MSIKCRMKLKKIIKLIMKTLINSIIWIFLLLYRPIISLLSLIVKTIVVIIVIIGIGILLYMYYF